MATYFSEYLDFGKASILADLAETVSPDFLYAAGSLDIGGLFVKTKHNGDLDWSHQYVLPGHQIGFTSVVECDNGDFMLYGSHRMQPERNRNLLVRVDSAGQVIWAKSFYTDLTRYNIRMVKSGKETYFLTSWLEESRTVDEVEVLKVDGAGNLLKAKRIGTSRDDQVNGMVPYKNGVVVFGGTSEGPGWDGFMLHLDSDLNYVWGSLVGEQNFQEFRTVVPLDQDRFAVAGESQSGRDSCFFTFDPVSTSFNAVQYDLVPGVSDGGSKRMILADGFYYLIGDSAVKDWSYVTKLDSKYTVLWHKRLNTGGNYLLRDIQVHPQDPAALRLCGRLVKAVSNGFLVVSDLELDTCMTVELERPKPSGIVFSRKDWKPPVDDLVARELVLQVKASRVEPQEGTVCSDNPLRLQNAYFQSPYVYLQAAGSTAADDSVYGFHLRWIFLRSLGDKHLAKGDLSGSSGPYPSTLNFNRDDDFVKIYRAEFREEFWTTISLGAPPNAVVESGLVRMWSYTHLLPVPSRPSNLNTVEILFPSIAQYDTVRATINPASNPMGFIQQYGGVIEARVKDKLSFLVRVFLSNVNPSPLGVGFVKLETVSLPDALDPTSAQLSCRKHLQNLSPNDTPETICENIHRIRFSYGGNVAPIRLRFLTYDDYLMGLEDRYPMDWVQLGDYALTIDTPVAHQRLEEVAKFVVHNTWRKFNEPTPSGEFRVNVDNYQHRWSMADGLRDGVIQYLTLSQTDPTATTVLPNNDPMANDSQMEVSFLDMLNIVSLDFHVARMLGLGTIDAQPPSPIEPRYVFLMEYETWASLEGEPPSVVQHLYMTPPLTVLDHKLPPVPVLEPVAYGLFGNNLTGNPTPFTDPNGYLPYADARFINLNKEQFRYELPFETFFQTNEEFCLCDETLPMSFGVEYGPGGIGSGGWVRPELENDPDYQDPGGLNEVIPLAETHVNPIFVHQETQVGVHHYALYSINWFSRVSPIGNEVETDSTQFPLRCPLLPPLNLQAQLIQVETPLIFTTGAEQAMLAGLSSTDKTLLRVTFDWNYVHNLAYQFADKVQFYFRVDPPLVVKGEIAAGSGTVVVDPINHLVTVQTTSYLVTSISPSQTVTPVIPLADKPKFIGGSFVANGVAFVIEDITTTVLGTNPEFVLRQIRETHNQESPANSNIWYTTETWVSPAAGERFFLYENLSPASAWDQVLTKEVTIVNFMPTYTETVVHPDGNVAVKTMGGLTDTATVTHRYDLSPGAPPFTPTGAYDIVFDTHNLGNHPDVDVDFYRGIARIAALSGEKKELQVWAMDSSGSTLVLTVYDPTFASDPIIPTTPPSQAGISVNFHPSYRVYFKVDGAFNEAHTLPGFDEGTRLTYLDARSRDTATGCASHLSPPAVILAREIREPVPPGVPTGPLFATRPNFYGKATYTFDVEVDHPYALIFYRANERKVLDTLYKADTVALILDELAALPAPDAAFFQDRWSDLVNMALDSGNNFKEYVTGGWRFKQPDNPYYKIPHPDPGVNATPFAFGLTLNDTFTYYDTITNNNVTLSMIDIVTDAIDGAFLPLTELPLIYAQVHDNEFVTSGRAPLIRDTNGQLLIHPHNDPWPMAIKYEKNSGGTILQSGDPGYGGGSNTRYVRFTDFTLDGEAQNFYFYFAVELSNTLKVSGRSMVAGPIQLVNSGAAKAPKIKKVETVLRSAALETGPAVRFVLNPIVESENIQRLEIYRSFDAASALSVRTMTLAKTLNVGDDVVDDFDDLGDAPYGEPLFYRIVALREIVNEHGNVEYVPSLPSNTALTNIVDNLNPPAPQLVVTSDPPTGSPIELPNVLLTWNKTVHNGTYYVFKLNSTGNWVKIYSVDPSVHLNAASMSIPLAGTTVGASSLFKQDADLVTIYHRFRVDVENSSGLLNLDKKEVTV